jgi:hypothetical protein
MEARPSEIAYHSHFRVLTPLGFCNIYGVESARLCCGKWPAVRVARLLRHPFRPRHRRKRRRGVRRKQTQERAICGSRAQCPHPAEADMSPPGADSGFDPQRRLAASKSRGATGPPTNHYQSAMVVILAQGTECNSID